MSLTRELREELAHRPLDDPPARLAEARAIVRLAGRLHLRGGDHGTTVEVVVRSAHGSVARRLRGTLVDEMGVRPGLAQQRPGNLSGSGGYLVTVDAAALRSLQILDADGRPARLTSAAMQPPGAYLAGALMAAGTLSGPGQPLHLEIRAPSRATAEVVASAIDGATASGDRVVVKGGAAIESLLGSAGATVTLERVRRTRRDREHRRQANRAVNADRANLARATAAAGTHVEAIERIVTARGWDGLEEDLRAVALVRVANPALSLAELGALLDPPVSKATVHRRLARLQQQAERIDHRDVPGRPDFDPHGMG